MYQMTFQDILTSKGDTHAVHNDVLLDGREEQMKTLLMTVHDFLHNELLLLEKANPHRATKG